MSSKKKCHQNCNVTKTVMLPKPKCHQNCKVTNTEMSPHLKCHHNWNVITTEMSPNLKCLQYWYISQMETLWVSTAPLACRGCRVQWFPTALVGASTELSILRSSSRILNSFKYSLTTAFCLVKQPYISVYCTVSVLSFFSRASIRSQFRRWLWQSSGFVSLHFRGHDMSLK